MRKQGVGIRLLVIKFSIGEPCAKFGIGKEWLNHGKFIYPTFRCIYSLFYFLMCENTKKKPLNVIHVNLGSYEYRIK